MNEDRALKRLNGELSVGCVAEFVGNSLRRLRHCRVGLKWKKSGIRIEII
jgi:hypothetical protein